MDDANAYRTFRSIRHPLGQSRAAVIGTRFVKPLGACMLPVMIFALVEMLQGFPALKYVTVGFPLAAVTAALWTWIRIRADIVEIQISSDKVSVQSLFMASEPERPKQWVRLLGVQEFDDRLEITHGYDNSRLYRKDWPDFEALKTGVEQAVAELSV